MTDNTQAEQHPDAALADQWAAAMDEQQGAEALSQTAENQTQAQKPATASQATSAESVGHGAAAVKMPDLHASSSDGQVNGEQNLELILDIPVTISMEIGRVKVPIRNLLQLTQGSVVELERLAGEPLDVLVNGTLIAHGEVVVVNERFGIRFTDVVSPAERVQKLR